jgi:oligopeptide/dipeptide ABC transporter ATP-binding protein
MLDVSVRAGVMNLMLDLREDLGVSYLFVTHDLGVARYMADRIAVMYLGRIVETGPAEGMISAPQHPYTRLLIAAVPGKVGRQRVRPAGTPPNAAAIPSGCRFHPRCPLAIDRCRIEDPVLREVAPNQWAACHLAGTQAAEIPFQRSSGEENSLHHAGGEAHPARRANMTESRESPER